MFIIENYINSRNAKIEAWLSARQKYLNDGDDEIGYRSKSRWENDHPYPVIRWGSVLRVAATVFSILLVIGLCAMIIISNEHQPHRPHRSKTTTSQKREYQPKIGDTVKIVRGSFANSVGKVVKVGDNNVIISLTNSTLTPAMCKAQNCSGGGKKNGDLLYVNSFGNLVLYKTGKE